MSGKGHVSIAITSSVATASFLLPNFNITSDNIANIIMYSVIGALIADVDHAGSTLGSRVKLFAILFKHRGFTHTIWFILIVVGISTKFISNYNSMFLCVGMLSHILGDILTPEGLKPFKLGFSILDIRVCLPIIQNNIVEDFIILISNIATAYVVLI